MCHDLGHAQKEIALCDVDIVVKKQQQQIDSGLACYVLIGVAHSLNYASRVHNILTTVMTNIFVDKSIQTTLSHCRFLKLKITSCLNFLLPVREKVEKVVNLL